MATGKKQPLIVIAGPTGSGKSSLSLYLAQRFNGEIICADARTIYKYMDIGTAKPTRSEQQAVPHHLIDVVKPDQPFSAAKFQKLAQKAIRDILKRGKLPIMVGGTGLYIDSVLFNYSFLPAPDIKLRQKLQHMSPKQLMLELDRLGVSYDHVDSKNPRRLQRLIETKGGMPERQQLRAHTLVLGMSVTRAQLRSRIEQRIENMFRDGFLREVEQLLHLYPADLEAFRAPGYKPAIDYLAGKISKKQAKTRFLANDLNLAKRQNTWFKRHREIVWLKDSESAAELVEQFLHSLSFDTINSNYQGNTDD